jgi:hypothetical protein
MTASSSVCSSRMSGVSRPPAFSVPARRARCSARRRSRNSPPGRRKTRQARTQRHLEALLERLDEVERVAVVGLDDLAVGDDLGAQPAALHPRARRQADERVAPEALAADDGLEQEALRLAAGQLEVQRQRRLEVGEGLEDQRDAVETLGGQALEFEFGDHVGRTPVAGCAATTGVDEGSRRGPAKILDDACACGERDRRPWCTRGARATAVRRRRTATVPGAGGQRRQARAFVTNGVARPRLPGRATAPRTLSRRCRRGRSLSDMRASLAERLGRDANRPAAARCRAAKSAAPPTGAAAW